MLRKTSVRPEVGYAHHLCVTLFKLNYLDKKDKPQRQGLWETEY